MSNGLLVEKGIHNELINNKSYYYKMIEKQKELEKIREVF
jgi:ABC-type multidrug transport system fused ATPase/permease subunit